MFLDGRGHPTLGKGKSGFLNIITFRGFLFCFGSYHGNFVVRESFFHSRLETADDLVHLHAELLVTVDELGELFDRLQLHPAGDPLEVDVEALHEVDRIEKSGKKRKIHEQNIINGDPAHSTYP